MSTTAIIAEAGRLKAGRSTRSKLMSDLRKGVKAAMESRRRDVPAHGWEFAAALRAEIKEMGDG